MMRNAIIVIEKSYVILHGMYVYMKYKEKCMRSSRVSTVHQTLIIRTVRNT